MILVWINRVKMIELIIIDLSDSVNVKNQKLRVLEEIKN